MAIDNYVLVSPVQADLLDEPVVYGIDICTGNQIGRPLTNAHLINSIATSSAHITPEKLAVRINF